MGISHLYALYEAGVRKIFQTAEGMSSKELNRDYKNFHDVIRTLEGKWSSRLPKNVFTTIMEMKRSRNLILHQGRRAKLDFNIIIKSQGAVQEALSHYARNVARRMRE